MALDPVVPEVPGVGMLDRITQVCKEQLEKHDPLVALGNVLGIELDTANRLRIVLFAPMFVEAHCVPVF